MGKAMVVSLVSLAAPAIPASSGSPSAASMAPNFAPVSAAQPSDQSPRRCPPPRTAAPACRKSRHCGSRRHHAPSPEALQPAHRARVEPAGIWLELADQRLGAGMGHARRRRRVQRRRAERRASRDPSAALDAGAQMPHAAGLRQRGAFGQVRSWQSGASVSRMYSTTSACSRWSFSEALSAAPLARSRAGSASRRAEPARGY